MKPPPFDYHDPSSLDDALELLADAGDDAAVIAGGQSLVPLLNLRLARPEVVIDPRRIRELHELAFDGGGVRAGALVTAAILAEHPRTAQVPGLAESLGHIGHPQIRNRTTIGGSIAHADPAAELPAFLVATHGSVTLHSRARGQRVVGAAEFFTGPFMTTREPDEILTSVWLPAYPGVMTVTEVAPRPGDFATVGTVVGLVSDGQHVSSASIVAFGVAGTPVRVGAAEDAISGASVADAAGLAAHAVRSNLDAVGDTHAPADYRRHVAGTLVARSIQQMTNQEAR